jgi:3-hydroxyisobutyrate dehydrogenase-like beta-hydroxyacid dehydrogenase
MSMPVDILDKRTVEIGFIGLGLMGRRRMRRLHSAGWNHWL